MLAVDVGLFERSTSAVREALGEAALQTAREEAEHRGLGEVVHRGCQGLGRLGGG
jgi:hypothetical protein